MAQATHRISRLWHRMGFRQQLIFVFCAGIVFAVLASSAVITVLTGQTIRDRFILEGHKAVETLALQSTLALLYQSAENGRDYAETVLGAPDVTGVAIIDLSGRTLLALGSGSENPDIHFGSIRDTVTMERDNAWLFISPVYANPVAELAGDSPFIVNPSPPELLGHALLVMTKDTLTEVSGDIMSTNLLVSGTLAAGLLAVLLFITGRVTRPVKSLAETMRRATSGERRIRAEIAGPRDVTEMQQAFNTMMGVLNARESELKNARDAALESARIKGEFAATVSHELRTPLNGVLGMLELLRDMGLSEKQADYVEVARCSGEALLALINDILDFSRNDSGGAETVAEDFELRAVLDEIVGLTGSEARRKGIELGFTVDPAIPDAVRGDVRRLQQILLNLVGNAVKFTEAGEVRIAVSIADTAGEGGRHLYFEIIDTGIGVPASGLEHIFEPFRQLDGSTTRRYGGSGLGLAICRQLAEFSGGRIGVRSVPGEGSTFWFTLPLTAASQPLASLAATDARLVGKRILVATGSGISRAQIVQTCERWEMRVHSVESVRRLLDALRGEASPDLVLVDERLPDEEGRPFEEIVRSVAARCNAPITVLSAQTGSPHPDQPRVAGSIDLPVRTSLLHKRLLDAVTSAAMNDSEGSDPAAALPAQATVLVVEDNRANQIVVAGMLERLGLEPALASGGREALALLGERHFDLILMDCNMPDMDGFQTTAAIREIGGATSAIPIIAMTANVQDGDAERCLAAGMDDYLPKPLKLSALRDKLSGWIDRRGGEPGAARTADEAPAQMPRLDEGFIEDLRTTLGSSFCRMLAVFREDLPSYLEALQHGVAEQAPERVINVAHTIKGSAANIGAVRLSEVCKRIEAAAGHGDLDTAGELYVLAAAEGSELIRLLERYGSAEAETTTRDSAPQPAWILVVDDDRATRFALRNVLEEEGYVVVEAHDGANAIDRCRERAPDLILMDARMPVMDGFAACQFIKENDEYAHIPVLIITGLEDDDSIERAFAVGATDYVSKPLNFSVLRRRIAHLMNASRAEHTMRRLAYNDALTGLPNRTQFTNQLSPCCIRAAPRERLWRSCSSMSTGSS